MTRDWATEERQKRVWDGQRNFRRSCSYLVTGILIAGIIIFYNIFK